MFRRINSKKSRGVLAMGDMLNKLLSFHGNVFEDLFSDIMKKYFGDRFQQTQAYGNKGDMKVDGILDNHVAFAVYAPIVYTDSKEISKIKSDFYGFLKHRKNGKWENIDTWIFVVKSNQPRGVTSEVMNLIAELSNEYNFINIKVWTVADIEPFIINNGTLSNLYASILWLKNTYSELNKIYAGLERNSNVLFHPKNEENGIMWYNKFIDTLNVNNEIAEFRHNNYFLANKLKIGEAIDELISLAPPYNLDLGEMLYTGFESMVDENKQSRRKTM